MTVRSTQLRNIADIYDSLHKTPDYSEIGYPMLRVTDIKQGQIDLSRCLKVSKSNYQEYTKKYHPNEGDIVISRVGTYGITCFVKHYQQFCLGQNTAIISPKINSRYIYYCLQSLIIKEQIEQLVVGSTQKTLSLKSIREIEIPTHEPQIMDAISHILGTLDDKIELNRRMNETLESIARAIFKSWFIDFDPVRAKAERRQPEGMDAETAALFPSEFEVVEGQEIPKGWVVKPIGDIIDVKGGSTPSTENELFWGGNIPFCTPKDLASNKIPFLLSTERCITELGVKEISSGILPLGTVLLSSRAPIGYIAITTSPVSVNQGFIAIIPNEECTNYYVFEWLKANMDVIVGNANGTTFLEISKKNFKPIPMILPPIEIMKTYQSIISSFFTKICSNLTESKSLEDIRDTLLPKLLSGELPIPNPEQFTGIS